MRRADLLLLIVTALCWSSSFLFIKVAVGELDPVLVMELRCIVGALPLWATAWWMRRRRGEALGRGVAVAVRQRPWSLLALGVLTGLPLWLVAIAEEHIDSGLAGIVNASVPLWAALLALRFDRQHPTGPRRLVGVAVGFAGVVLLAAARGAIGGSAEVVGILTVASAGCMYAAGAVLVRERLARVPSVEQAAWSVTIAAALFAVPSVMALPDSLPSADAIGSILALGLLGTFLGFLGYYELLARIGAARATMVTYLLPPLAVGYGWLLLEERVGFETLGAMLVVLLGVWLGSRPERVRAEPVPAS
ncbi:MAG: family transporter [Thermoleophilia bacterium]|jgi:drug/metabolite transporter (DMT)-like permease|nr:family transporter [Thermoleophilia bacterium]